MAYTNFPDGLTSFGVPLIGSGQLPIGSNYLFVDSNSGSDGGDGSFEFPYATLDFAIGRCTASKGYIIVCKQGHAETLTSAITMDVAGVTVVGLGVGRNRPAFTANFGSAGDTLTVTAANCAINNLRFVASSASQNAQVNVAAADFMMSNCVIEQGANNLIGVTVASGGDRFVFDNCLWLGTGNGPDVAIDFESSASDNFAITNCEFNFTVFGCDLGVIRAAADVVEGGLIQDCVMMGVDTVAIDFNSSAGATGDGLVSRCTFIASAALTSIEDIIDVGGYNFSQCYAADAVTGRAAQVPITSVS
jgi:hypothetical protein